MSDVAYTWDSSVNRQAMMICPFYPFVKDDGDEYKLIFNQAYVFDYHNAEKLAEPIKIAGMDTEYSAAEGKEQEFYVKLTISVDNGAVENAELVKEKEEESKNLFIDDEFPENPHERQSGVINQFIKVCKMIGPHVEEFYLRDNIHWWMRKIEQLGSFIAPSDEGGGSAPIINTEQTSANNQQLKIRAIKAEESDDNGIKVSYNGEYIELFCDVSPLTYPDGGDIY